MTRAFIVLLITALSVPALGQLPDVVVPGEDWQVAVEGLGFADGLSYDREGNVFFADLRGGNAGVFKLSPDGIKPSSTTPAAAVRGSGPTESCMRAAARRSSRSTRPAGRSAPSPTTSAPTTWPSRSTGTCSSPITRKSG